MASIIKKKTKSNTYYYYVESKRIDGKPRHVNKKYLGTAETIYKKLNVTSGIAEPLFSIILDFADVSALLDIASRLGVVNIINKYAKKRNQGVSVGGYILVAAINRAVAPTSKSDIAHWYSKTILSRLLQIDEKALSSQHYWNHMCMTDAVLSKIEEELVKTIVDSYKIDTTHLIYDAYPGNRPDSKQFSVMLDKLKARYEKITAQKTDITIIFDRGNNSQDNIDFLEQEQFPLHYVGGLKRNQCSDLFDIDKSNYLQLSGDNFKKVTAYRTTKNVYKRDMTVVVTYNQNLSDGQMQGILINIDKTKLFPKFK